MRKAKAAAPGVATVGAGKTGIRTTLTNPFGKKSAKRGAKRAARAAR